MKDKLLSGIMRAFSAIEVCDLRVGAIWLNPREVAFLETEATDVFDRVRDAFLETFGAPCVGVLFGANVFPSAIVPEGCIAILPDGFQAKLVDPAAAFSLGLQKVPPTGPRL